MPEESFPFSTGGGANVSEDRWSQMARFFVPNGVHLDDLETGLIYGDSSGMHVKAKLGVAGQLRASVEGVFYRLFGSEKIIPLAMFPGGNPRIDLIVLRLNRLTKTVTIEAVTGTQAASPVAPAPVLVGTIYEVPLAEVLVDTNTSIAVGKVSDRRLISSGIGGSAGGVVKLADVLLGVDTATITFQNIPQTFSSLEIVASARSARTTSVAGINVRLNNNAGAVYDWQQLVGEGAAAVATRGLNQTSGRIGVIPGAPSDVRAWGQVISRLLEYRESAKWRMMTGSGGYATGDDAPVSWTGTMLMTASPGPINRMDLVENAAANFLAGSRFTLFGVR